MCVHVYLVDDFEDIPLWNLGTNFFVLISMCYVLMTKIQVDDYINVWHCGHIIQSFFYLHWIWIETGTVNQINNPMYIHVWHVFYFDFDLRIRTSWRIFKIDHLPLETCVCRYDLFIHLWEWQRYTFIIYENDNYRNVSMSLRNTFMRMTIVYEMKSFGF